MADLMDSSEASDAPIKRASNAPPRGFWAVFVRGWRPFTGWMLGFAIPVRVVILPALQFAKGQPVDPVDWTAIAALAAVLVASRTYERSQGLV